MVGNARYGVYAFYDYDGEPIYVGQTSERLRVRIRRHLTNQRTDAVAMNVLDPFEVSEIEMWPFWELERLRRTDPRVHETLRRAESTIFQGALRKSRFGAVLNEVVPPVAKRMRLPPSIRRRIIPDRMYEQRKHADVRIARRANTIARLTQVISERDVSPGLRRTLRTQARRLEHLAAERLHELRIEAGMKRPTPRAELARAVTEEARELLENGR
jgi:hypothetical protein